MPAHQNLSAIHLLEEAIKRKEGVLSNQGAFLVHTGKYTGRSPMDKFTVCNEQTKDVIWWHEGNKQMLPEHAQAIYEKITDYITQQDHFINFYRAGASAKHSVGIKVTTQRAWHNLFASNMFLAPLNNQSVDFEIFHAPGFKADPARDHTNSECAIVLDLGRKRILICGTEYAGEIKKSVFTLMNYLLPKKGVLGMHCSANKNQKGEPAIFFGLSGTGKTTLSAEASRSLIGDDEHGWDEEGVFNFEGGCYAKAIKLSQKDEPEIFKASNRFGSVLENVVFDEKSREVDFFDSKLTENTRCSYKLSAISNACLSGKGAHPKKIIMLTCDAFGVLPPLAKLSPEQAAYHFINGYTAKVAGTERGIKEPKAVFSPCFGAPFMAHKPGVYAKLLMEKIEQHQGECWLVNTGWIKGPYGVGERVKLAWTRLLLNAALDDKISSQDLIREEFFGLMIPKTIEGVPNDILDPKLLWPSPKAYEEKAKALAALFHENFSPYSSLLSAKVKQAGPLV